MARQFGRLNVTIWRDSEWLALSDPAMVLYLSLLSQHDISPAGVLTIAERRWGKFLDGGRPAVDAAIDELVAARFILIDEETSEILVRTFIRHDGRLFNGRLAASVDKAIAEIMSDQLRSICSHEAAAGRKAVERSRRAVEGSEMEETPGARALTVSMKGLPDFDEGPSRDECSSSSSCSGSLLESDHNSTHHQSGASNSSLKTSPSSRVDTYKRPVDKSAREGKSKTPSTAKIIDIAGAFRTVTEAAS